MLIDSNIVVMNYAVIINTTKLCNRELLLTLKNPIGPVPAMSLAHASRL